MGRKGIKNDGGSQFNYDILLRTFVNATMYSQYNNNEQKHMKKFSTPLTIKEMQIKATLRFFLATS
jgi:hypothetical protein